ncbi:MAG: phytoene/squalene synthase family protein [Acidobacteriota bacterium]|nr:phytoene/squalene synthase family protein [Acidobacteriota bacterium]
MSGVDPLLRRIFRRGSRTYFHSTRFFPAETRRDVACLYGFVRTADDFVDRIPQDREGFQAFRKAYETCRNSGETSGNNADPVIAGFCELARRRGFDPAWVDAFLDSMAMDLTRKDYATLSDTLSYIYGSAEVIGLMMAAVMDLRREAFPFARLLGRAMQYINFIRDIREDGGLGRTYLPADAMKMRGLDSLTEDEAHRKPEAFRIFLRGEIRRYQVWQIGAEKGYAFIPRRFLDPIRTAAAMYDWTARKIAADPFIVFRRKVKPSRPRILWTGLRAQLSGKGLRA